MSTYNFIDRTGQVFGRLTVTKRAPNKNGRTMWECLCSCGEITVVRGEHLKNGKIQSCGCYSEESHTKHGKTKTPEYHCWIQIKQRCLNEKDKSFINYGGRGIGICDRWRDSFEFFLFDMGERPTAKHTIERINNDKGYSSDNCKWATRREQVNNRRNTILFTFDGKTQCLKDWCRELDIPYATARNRIKRGQSIKQALKLE